jgi:hypothetical protein
MNYVEAAVTLLGEAGRPMHVAELCRQALERGILSRPGSSPLRSMKGQLTSELKKGTASRVVRIEPEVWALPEMIGEAVDGLTDVLPRHAEAGEAGAETAAEAAGEVEEVAAEPAGAEEADAAWAEGPIAAESAEVLEEAPGPAAGVSNGVHTPEAGGAAAGRRRRRRRGGRGRRRREGRGAAAGEVVVNEAAGTEEEIGAEVGAAVSRWRAAIDASQDDEEFGEVEELADETGGLAEAAEFDDTDEFGTGALDAGTHEAELAPEEREMVDLYRDELAAGTVPVATLSEYRDEHSDDEDRPLLPEIVHRRDRRYREGRERRGRAGERRSEGRGGAAGRSEGRAEARAEHRAEGGRAENRSEDRDSQPVTLSVATNGVSDRTTPAAAAYHALAGSGVRGSMPLRQLAQVMRKRNLLREDDSAFTGLKLALRWERGERSVRGLRPRVQLRGRDVAVRNDGRLPAAVLAAEQAVEAALKRLAELNRQVLGERLGQLPPAVLERVTQFVLEQAGWEQLQWIKRVERSSYATGKPPGGSELALVAVRCGNTPVDRRGVGELRAGLEAKDLTYGFLFAPRELSAEARGELERGGRPIVTTCGVPFVDRVLALGIGAQVSHAPITYLDPEFFDDLDEA